MRVIKCIGYWILQCTWGIVMTLIGAVAALGLIITGHKPKVFGYSVYFEVGNNWGGVELGGFFLCDKNSDIHTKRHEHGHGLQNILWGPLFPIVIAIPSAVRYHLRNRATQHGKKVFALAIMLITLIITTALAILFGIGLHIKVLTIIFEALRLYCLAIFIWLFSFEIPKYEKQKYVAYDDIWFEGQATKWGNKIKI